MRKYMRLTWICLAVLIMGAPAGLADPADTGGGGEIKRAGKEDPKPKTEKPKEGEAKKGEAKEKEEETTDPDQKDDKPKAPGGIGSFFSNPMFMIVIVFVVMMLLMGRRGKKERRQRKEMLSTLKKGDKITSIGGMVGTIIEVREDEVTVKVDETNNIRVKFARWAIRGKGVEGKAERPEDKK